MKVLAAAAALLLGSCGADNSQPDIAISDAWARTTGPGQSSSAAYFTITNRGGEDRLLAITSHAADASLHSNNIDGGIVRMRPLGVLDIPGGSTVALEPNETHVMLMNMKAPLVSGDRIPLQLRFEKSGERSIEAEVRSGTSR